MGLNNLKPADRSKFKKKRVGRGPGSGLGKTSGRGHKGAQSRSGYSFKRGFEGGQMPLHRRVPKRGFTNIFRTEYDVVNLDQLEKLFDKGATVTVEALRERGIVSSRTALVKVLGARRGHEGPDRAGAQIQRKGRREAGRRGWQGRGDCESGLEAEAEDLR